MKKIVFSILLFFLFISPTFAKSKFYIDTKLSDVFIHVSYKDKIYNGNMYVYVRDDGEVVYCINPFELIELDSYYEEYNFNNQIFNLSDEQLNKINLISYYGYNYYNHDDIKWYVATQFLIWKELGVEEIYFTDYEFRELNGFYKDEIEEISTLVNSHFLQPSFSNKHYEYASNKDYKLEDDNNVLYKYEILETNIDVEMINNELNIHTKEDGLYEIRFIRKSPIESNYKLYNLYGAQALIYPGKLDDLVFSLKVEVNSGSIILNKFDSESKDRIDATLEGAIYGLYNISNDELLKTFKTDKDGVANLEDIELGKYYVKEISPSIGYQIDDNIYYVNFTKENKNVVINSYEKTIKGDLVLNKYYGLENNYEKEDGAVFQIYDSQNKLVDTITTENGFAKKTLDYGKYYVLQTKGINGYNFIEKFDFFVTDYKEYEFDLYNMREVLIVDVPDTFKNDYYYNGNYFLPILLIIIGILFILFNIKVKTTELQ